MNSIKNLPRSQKRCIHLNDQDFSEFAKLHPEFAFTSQPFRFYTKFRDWVIKFKPEWVAKHYPLDIMKERPEWMCFNEPETAMLLNASLMMSMNQQWVVKNAAEQAAAENPDFLDRYDPELKYYHYFNPFPKQKKEGLFSWLSNTWKKFFSRVDTFDDRIPSNWVKYDQSDFVRSNVGDNPSLLATLKADIHAK